MTEYKDSEFVFAKEIDENTWKRIGKKIISIGAEIKKCSHHSSRK
jgi:hypothetical protein